MQPDDRLVVLLPGSRHGEVARHMPYLIDAAQKISMDAAQRIAKSENVRFICALPPGFNTQDPTFAEPIRAASIQTTIGKRINMQVIEGMTWDCLAQAEIALAASGTVTIEAALLGAPMVTFYRVNALSWILGRWLVSAPFLSMVNLVAQRKIVAELIQKDMTAEKLAAEALQLLDNPAARRDMRAAFMEVREKLLGDPTRDPMEVAADQIDNIMMEAAR